MRKTRLKFIKVNICAGFLYFVCLLYDEYRFHRTFPLSLSGFESLVGTEKESRTSTDENSKEAEENSLRARSSLVICYPFLIRKIKMLNKSD